LSKSNFENVHRSSFYLVFHWYLKNFFTIMKNINIKLPFFNLNKLNKFIKIQKNTLPKFSNKNVMYKISCKDAICRMLVKQIGNYPREYLSIVEYHNSSNKNQSVTTELVLIMNLIGRMSKFLERKDFSINVWIQKCFIHAEEWT